MEKRTQKQIIIAIIFFVILILLGFFIYEVARPKPSCFDNIKNQDETDIDCGGKYCNPCEAPLKEIQTLEQDIIYAQEDYYDIGIKIWNPNLNYGSGQIPYNLKYYDDSNNLIGQRLGATYILPNQQKYILEIKIQSLSPIANAELTFEKAKWQEFKNYQRPELVIKDQIYEITEDGFVRTKGAVINRSNFDFSKVWVNIVLFDSQGKALGLGTTEINALTAGQQRECPYIWPYQISDQIYSVAMEAETNIFDSDNFMERYSIPGKFKEF